MKSKERPRARGRANKCCCKSSPSPRAPKWTLTMWKHTEPQKEPNIYLLKATMELGSLAKSNPLFYLLSKVIQEKKTW